MPKDIIPLEKPSSLNKEPNGIYSLNSGPTFICVENLYKYEKLVLAYKKLALDHKYSFISFTSLLAEPDSPKSEALTPFAKVMNLNKNEGPIPNSNV